MKSRLYLDIFEEFKKMCPWASRKIISWHPSGELEITAVLDDGSAIQYDYIFKSFRSAPSIDILKENRKPNNEDSWRREFSIKLYRKMKVEGMTQDDLSWKSGISAGSIANYVNGVSTPSAYNVYKIAEALKCQASELVDI